MAHTGVVKSFNQQKGWGFIECAETFHIAQKDIFVLKSSLPGGVAAPGDTVRFDVQQGQKGPEAANVQLLGRLGQQRPTFPPSAAPRMTHPPAYPAATAFARPPAAAGPGQTRGIVKSYNHEKGWGFISSPALQQTLGKDIFFMKSSVAGAAVLGPGAEVSFNVTQGQKGPEAKEVTPLGAPGGAWAPPAAARQQAGLLAGLPPSLLQAVVAANPALRGLIAPGAGAAGGGAAGGSKSMVGTVKGWNEEKGWGHISSECATATYGKDIFFMRSTLNGEQVEIGALVSVKVTLAAKGPQAESVRFLPAGAIGSQVFSGEVKSYTQEKGWGFVSGPEVLDVFGKDIFLHKQELGGITPNVGDAVQFTVEVSNKGQLQAKNVVMPNGASGGVPFGGVMQPPPTAAGYSPY